MDKRFPFRSLEALQRGRNIVVPSLRSTRSWSPEVLNFLHSLLTVDPDARPSAERALQHPWFQGMKETNLELEVTGAVITHESLPVVELFPKV
jgi:serine/threonine protein kinase